MGRGFSLERTQDHSTYLLKNIRKLSIELPSFACKGWVYQERPRVYEGTIRKLSRKQRQSSVTEIIKGVSCR